MKNIQLSTIDFYLKNIIFLFISILIYISTSELVFAKGLDKNINNIKSPEEELAIKYCDAINKKIFKGLNKEASLKYEYYFSSFKKPSTKDHKLFLKIFKLKLMKIFPIN